MAASLPPEVLGTIAHDLSRGISKTALVNFCLTARAFRTEGQRALFRSLDTGFTDGGNESRLAEFEMHRLFLSAIIAAPARLGACVRVYTSWFLAIAPARGDVHPEEDTIPEDDNDNDEKKHTTFNMHNPHQAALWNVTYEALPLMTHLKHLRFGAHRRGFGQTTETSTSILQNCTFTLESLSWGRLLDLPALATDFLLRQPELRHLQIGTGKMSAQQDIDIPEISPTAMPLLQTVCAPPVALLAILPKRHVKAVSWSTPIDQPMGVFPAESQHHLAILAQRVGKFLPETRYLALPDLTALTQMAQRLTAVNVLYLKACSTNESITPIEDLVSLKVLILDLKSHMSDALDEVDLDIDEWEDSVKSLASRMFSVCSTLQEAYIQHPLNRCSYLSFGRGVQGEPKEMEDRSVRMMMEHFQLWMPRELLHAHVVPHYL